MEIFVCIGSSCHLKGSYQIIKAMEALIDQHGLKDEVSLNASFCLGHCQNGVTTKIDGQIVTGVNPENVTEIFEKYVLKK